MEKLIAYAKTFVGIPYKWGGKTPLGFDCSGLIQEILSTVGIDPPGDQNAQAYFNHFLMHGLTSEITTGALIFYGKDVGNIVHIAMVINEHQVVEAGGGDATVLTPTDAERRRAYVRIRPITKRKDIVGIFLPVYPAWMKDL